MERTSFAVTTFDTICSRYFFEIPSESDTSLSETGPAPSCSARYNIKRTAYKPFVDIFMRAAFLPFANEAPLTSLVVDIRPHYTPDA